MIYSNKEQKFPKQDQYIHPKKHRTQPQIDLKNFNFKMEIKRNFHKMQYQEYILYITVPPDKYKKANQEPVPIGTDQ